MTTFALREHIARKSRTARSWACGIPQLLLLCLISTGCGPLQGTVGNPDSAAVAVSDNDGPVVTIAAGADQVTEGEDVLIAVRATPAAAADLVATLRVTETGSMLGTSPSTATITAGATTTTAPIRLDCRSSAWQAPRRRCVKAKRSSSG